eukprot:TRINITY_DN76317_c0_g1_i1.p1 TRINITY_DN76317_c0_g1~~TRINITY_DN76317_c0_g1_i1.p1  ORF type:complete len:537 (-),score=87.19 TRINITY_DN76317_c0_g1_i1:157-1767(-)
MENTSGMAASGDPFVLEQGDVARNIALTKVEAFLQTDGALDKIDSALSSGSREMQRRSHSRMSGSANGVQKGFSENDWTKRSDIAVSRWRSAGKASASSWLAPVDADLPVSTPRTERNVVSMTDEVRSEEDLAQACFEVNEDREAAAVRDKFDPPRQVCPEVTDDPEVAAVRREVPVAPGQIDSSDQDDIVFDLTEALERHLDRQGGFAAPRSASMNSDADERRKPSSPLERPDRPDSRVGSRQVFRFGLPRSSEETPRTARSDDSSSGGLRYLDIPETGLAGFQMFAKELAEKMKVECAESNPYIQALTAHREAYSQSIVDLRTEVVDSLEVRLATQRADALASLKMRAEEGARRQSFNDSGTSTTLGSEVGTSSAASSSIMCSPGVGGNLLAGLQPNCISNTQVYRVHSLAVTPGREEVLSSSHSVSLGVAPHWARKPTEEDWRTAQAEDLRSGTSTTARSNASGSEHSGIGSRVPVGEAFGEIRKTRDACGQPRGSEAEPGLSRDSSSAEQTNTWFGDQFWDKIFNGGPSFTW